MNTSKEMGTMDMPKTPMDLIPAEQFERVAKALREALDQEMGGEFHTLVPYKLDALYAWLTAEERVKRLADDEERDVVWGRFIASEARDNPIRRRWRTYLHGALSGGMPIMKAVETADAMAMCEDERFGRMDGG